MVVLRARTTVVPDGVEPPSWWHYADLDASEPHNASHAVSHVGTWMQVRASQPP